jgi:hypothetical protein
MAIDFNKADKPRGFDLIPSGTECVLQITIRPGNDKQDPLLKTSKDGNSSALDCECVVVEGPFARRKIWKLLTLTGNTEGHVQARDISMAFIRAVLESAHNVRYDDNSEAAQAARKIDSWDDLNNLRFLGKITVRKNPDYGDKNDVDVITPEHKAYREVSQIKAPKLPIDMPTQSKIDKINPKWGQQG